MILCFSRLPENLKQQFLTFQPHYLTTWEYFVLLFNIIFQLNLAIAELQYEPQDYDPVGVTLENNRLDINLKRPLYVIRGGIRIVKLLVIYILQALRLVDRSRLEVVQSLTSEIDYLFTLLEQQLAMAKNVRQLAEKIPILGVIFKILNKIYNVFMIIPKKFHNAAKTIISKIFKV